MTKKLYLNSISGTILFATQVAITFVIAPVLITSLGNRDYGTWELVMSVMGYMGLLDLGVGGALVRFVSVAEGQQDPHDLQQTISTAFFILLFVGTIALVLFFVLSIQPSLIGGSGIKKIANFRTVLILMGINAGILFPLQVFTATLMGFQRHFFINSVRVLTGLFKAVLIYYLVNRFERYGLVVLAVLTPTFTITEIICFSGAVFLDQRIPKLSLNAVTLRKAREIFFFGAKSSIMMIAGRLKNQTAPLIIGHVIGLAHIVYFTMPNRLIQYAQNFALAIGFPLTPYFGSAIGRGDRGELVNSWLNTSLALQIITLSMPISIFFLGDSFLGLWIGREYADEGKWLIYILLVGLSADALSSNAFRMLTAQAKHGKCALTWLVLSIVSIPFSIVGAHLWDIEGVAAGVTFTSVAGNLATLYMACRVMQVSLPAYLKHTVSQILIPLSLLILSFLGIRLIVTLQNYSSLIIHLAVAYAVYFSAIWIFTLEKSSRNKIIAIVMSRSFSGGR